MNKFLTIISSLLVLTTGITSVSCNKSLSNTKTDNTNKIDKNISNNNSSIENKQDNPKINEEPKDKNKKDKTLSEFENRLDQLIKNKEFEHVKNLAFELIFKNSLSLLEKQAEKKIREINEKILKLFSESNFDQIKAEITTLISNSFNNSKVTYQQRKEITELLDQVSLENKEKILLKINELFAKVTRSEFQEYQNKLINEIEQLITNKQYEKLKEKILSLANKKTN
ncbi:hypothetical protein I7634_02070 [Mycoplasma mycoides subsp. capri]|uniref:hypothetical protein n=1 Tax=Mycoplasma mycoides TaxID=2102 RepID=UPI00223F5693|nr:hypothetical protein [Mycoplasma mycoides]QVJ96710.1 hypothetical protein I7632_02100 [Mycoplasma mycoides subsp. capri]QVJ97602.1 hypothetical protein I7633_02070 [Mycoplasma mycoides subsp. capri]QVK00594.1 hypothetical protein I7634_02070 [Mycoplasma mycoides subsp. capri]QVK01482.1 hypothetical protein I7635_02070 [Mycoplasma mycoides subsp. capri]